MGMKSILGEVIAGGRKALDILAPEDEEAEARIVAEFEAAARRMGPRAREFVARLEAEERKVLQERGYIDTNGEPVG